MSCLERLSCVDGPQRSSERLKCVVAFIKKTHSTSSSSSTYSFAATNDHPDGSAPAISTSSARFHVLHSKCTPRPPSPTNLCPRTSPFCVVAHQYMRLALSGEVSLRSFIGSTRTHPLAPHGRADSSVRSSLTSNITHSVSSPARLHLGSRVVGKRLKVWYTFMTSIRRHTNRVQNVCDLKHEVDLRGSTCISFGGSCGGGFLFLYEGIMTAQSILDPARGVIDLRVSSLHHDISVELLIHNTAQNMHTQCNIKEYAVEQLTHI